MADAIYHAKSSAKRWGGVPEDYIAIHQKMDCSKSQIPDNRHRALTHHHFWINEVMIPIFGATMKNSAGREIPVKEICEQHILEDFGNRFIPNSSDYLESMRPEKWMNNALKGSKPRRLIYLEKLND
jgi:hypothetical protein